MRSLGVNALSDFQVGFTQVSCACSRLFGVTAGLVKGRAKTPLVPHSWWHAQAHHRSPVHSFPGRVLLPALVVPTLAAQTLAGQR